MWKKLLITMSIAVPAICLTGFLVNLLKQKLSLWFGIHIPPILFLLVLLLSVLAVAQLTTSKFFREAREWEERRKREKQAH